MFDCIIFSVGTLSVSFPTVRKKQTCTHTHTEPKALPLQRVKQVSKVCIANAIFREKALASTPPKIEENMNYLKRLISPPSPSLIPSEVPYCVFGHYPLTADASCKELLLSTGKVGRQMKAGIEKKQRERQTSRPTNRPPTVVLKIACIFLFIK